MTSRFYHLLLVSLMITLVLGCSKENVEPDQDENKEQFEVIVLFSTDGFYNFGYNDRFLSGIEKTSRKYNFKYEYYVPDTLSKGAQIYKNWLEKESDPNIKKSLFIFASNLYEQIYAASEAPAQNSAKEVLIMDIPHQVPNAYSIHTTTYGAAYYIGNYLSELTFEYSSAADSFYFHYILANKYDKELQRTYDGCFDGMSAFSKEYDIPICHTLSYISNSDEEGYKYLGYDDGTTAYMIAMEQDNKHRGCFPIFIPIAGASNLGVYRYSNMNGLYTMGMYLENSQAPLSIIKCFDVILDEFFQLWILDKEIPKYKQYSLGSDGVKVSRSIMDDYFTFDEILFQEAIEKEKEYYEKLNQ